LYVQSLHVPLLISSPGRVPSNVVVDEAVSLRDLPATILDLTGTDVAMPGSSLAGLWRGDGSGPRKPSPVLSELQEAPNQPAWYPIAGGEMQSIIVGNYHYIRRADGREELYDLARDVSELNDLVASGRSEALLKSLREALTAARGRAAAD
jgi:arylsulfatase A-like enzyme